MEYFLQQFSQQRKTSQPEAPLAHSIFPAHYMKSQVHPRTGHEGPEGEYRYNCTLSLTSALDGGEWIKPHPSRFTPEITQYPSYGRLGEPQGWSGWVHNISPPPGFDPQTVQPITSCHSNYAIPAPSWYLTQGIHLLLSVDSSITIRCFT